MTAPAPKPRLWPRYAVSPDGGRARFACMGDVPTGWTLETPLTPEAPLTAEDREMRKFNDMDKAYLGKWMDDTPLPPSSPPPKNKGGRPRKVAL